MSHRAKVWTALGTIYVLWGSTYLGIELTGETIPPLLAAAVRFVLAGLLMAGIATWRRGPRALKMTRREVASCALVGLLLPGANAMLFLAERRVPTGLSPLIIGSVPLWVVLMRTITGDRPPPAALVGLLDNAPIQRVATYAYVNPIVAIGLGALVLHETISWRIGLGAAIVLASVAIVVRHESVPAEAEGVTPDPRGLQVEPARESAASPSRPLAPARSTRPTRRAAA